MQVSLRQNKDFDRNEETDYSHSWFITCYDGFWTSE